MIRILLLTLATMLWGLGFVGSRWTFMTYGPFWSNGLRFLFAGLLCLPFFLAKGFHPKGLRHYHAAFVCAFALNTAVLIQTIGLQLTTLAKSGFLTTFYALFTPLLSLFLYKTRFRKTYWVLLGMAMFGIFLLCDLQLSRFNQGDLLTLLSAFFYSVHILLIDRYAPNYSSLELNGLQCIFIAPMAFAVAWFFEGAPYWEGLWKSFKLLSPNPVYGFVLLSFFSSILAFSIQVYAQKGIRPHIASLIFLMESLFATLFGYLFFKETLSVMGFLGCFFVLLSVALIPYFTNPKKNKNHREEGNLQSR